MSRETLEYRPAHSCATLANGILMAEHGDHAAVSPSLEEQIKAFLLINMLNSWFASQERIRAAQERLSALGLDSHLGLPEAHPAGYHCLEGYRAPYIARSDGHFVAGQAVATLESSQGLTGTEPAAPITPLDRSDTVQTVESMATTPRHEGYNSGFPSPPPFVLPATPLADAKGPPAIQTQIPKADSTQVPDEPREAEERQTPPGEGTYVENADGRSTTTIQTTVEKGGGDKLKELLKRHGEFAKIEVSIKKWVEKKARKMLDAAWDWAERHHKKRKNPVHGEEEIGIVLDDEFLFRTEKGEGMSQQGDFDLEDPTDYTAGEADGANIRAESSSFKLLAQIKIVIEQLKSVHEKLMDAQRSDEDIAGELVKGVEQGIPAKHACKMAGMVSRKLKKHGIADTELSLLAEPKNVKVSHGCRRLHAFAAKTGRRLPVEVVLVPTIVRRISKARVREVDYDYPTLPLSAWMETAFSFGGHFFLGGRSTDHFAEFSNILRDWWLSYKAVDPNLPFYKDFPEDAYGFSFPIAIHGDEGRGRYKRPIMIFSYQPVITNFDGKANLKGATYTNRLLYAAVPSAMYAKNDKTFDGLFDALVQDFNRLYEGGFEVAINGQPVRLRPVYVGLKGDWPFLRKIAKLKPGFQARNPRKCHLCDVQEWWNMSPDGPLRSLSVGYINPSPFKANCYLPLSNIPGGTEPSRIQTDPTHTYHIGYGKDENASALMVLVKIGHFGQRGTVDAKLERAFERYATWCKTNRKHTSISYFNKLQFKIQQRTGAYPSGGGKGHDTAILGSWLEVELSSASVASVDHPLSEVLEVVKYMNRASGSFWRTLYANGFFLSPDVATTAISAGWAMVEAYACLSSLTASLRLRLFKCRPKLHMMGHILLDLSHQLTTANRALNPTVWMCWGDEDFIGKISRSSRHQHSLTTPQRTIEVSLLSYHRYWKECFR
ncbi:unnamed protein product [Durusdinium trenchii]|uniref:Uncharacterized protein n=2 Tax=Durusdinium trenchii TaxID=1381693 RepID=A0ABP0MB70_9DINO